MQTARSAWESSREHLDDGVQVCQLAEVSVRQLARLHPRGVSQQLQAVQLSQYLLLHLWVLRDEVPAGASIMSKLPVCKWGQYMRFTKVTSRTSPAVTTFRSPRRRVLQKTV